ncbi:DUF4249 domain-containing protein [Pontibacter sp. 13R65]|uniref:DUF4249 domain-containing protein n=1 Tax=Pontibacter sp. 13R65 TaxID=3127458 RepID=UPI00301B8E17
MLNKNLIINYLNKKALPKALLLLLALGALLGFTGCSKYLDYELPYLGDKLVVNGLLSPDSVVHLRVSRTLPVTGDYRTDLAITGATVSFYENDKHVEDLRDTGNGMYASPSGFKPVPGMAYSVQVAAKGFVSVQTIPETVPFPPDLGSVVLQEQIKSIYNNVYTRKLGIEIKAREEIGEFFNIDITPMYQGERIFRMIFFTDQVLQAGSPCGFRGRGSYYFSGTCFRGSSYMATFGVELEDYVSGSPNYADQLTITCRSISKSYYEHLEKGHQPEDYLMAIMEPRFVHTNVIGGYGLLAAYNEHKIILNL